MLARQVGKNDWLKYRNSQVRFTTLDCSAFHKGHNCMTVKLSFISPFFFYSIHSVRCIFLQYLITTEVVEEWIVSWMNVCCWSFKSLWQQLINTRIMRHINKAQVYWQLAIGLSIFLSSAEWERMRVAWPTAACHKIMGQTLGLVHLQQQQAFCLQVFVCIPSHAYNRNKCLQRGMLAVSAPVAHDAPLRWKLKKLGQSTSRIHIEWEFG